MVIYICVLQQQVRRGLDVESVGVVRGGVAVTRVVGLVTGCVVECQACDSERLGVLDVETVHGPVLDDEVRNDGVGEVFEDYEVVWSRLVG